MFRQEHFQFQISFMGSQNGASSNKTTECQPDYSWEKWAFDIIPNDINFA